MNTILLKKSDFNQKSEFKNVLNFNFSTHILFRCIPRKYAYDFLKGKIMLNQPKIWIKEEKNGKKGQGDSLEGVFLSTKKNDNSRFISELKNNKENEWFTYDKLLYFRRRKINDLFCLCLYGLNSNMFTINEKDRFGNNHFIAKVKKEYFIDFSGKITEKEYFEMNELDRPVVLFINNPHLFFEKITDFFVRMGISKNDIIISPIEYVDLRKPFVSFVPTPYELLLKDNDFSNQSEVRIIINSSNDKLIKYMKEHNNIINVGDISDIVTIYDNYFHDLLLEKRDNTLLFTLPFPIDEELSKSTLRELLSYYIQISNDRLPYETTIKDREEMLHGISDIVNEKYGIDIIDRDGNITLSNVTGNIEEILDK